MLIPKVVSKKEFLAIITALAIGVLTAIGGMVLLTLPTGCATIQTGTDQALQGVYTALQYERTTVYSLVQLAKTANRSGLITDNDLEKVRKAYQAVQEAHNKAIDIIVAVYGTRNDWYNVTTVQEALFAANQTVLAIIELAVKLGVK